MHTRGFSSKEEYLRLSSKKILQGMSRVMPKTDFFDDRSGFWWVGVFAERKKEVKSPVEAHYMYFICIVYAFYTILAF